MASVTRGALVLVESKRNHYFVIILASVSQGELVLAEPKSHQFFVIVLASGAQRVLLLANRERHHHFFKLLQYCPRGMDPYRARNTSSFCHSFGHCCLRVVHPCKSREKLSFFQSIVALLEGHRRFFIIVCYWSMPYGLSLFILSMAKHGSSLYSYRL